MLYSLFVKYILKNINGNSGNTWLPRQVHVTCLINSKPQEVFPFYLVNMSITITLGFASVNISYAVFFIDS